MWKEVVSYKLLLKQRLSCSLKLFDSSGDFVCYFLPLWHPDRGDIHARVVYDIFIRSVMVCLKIEFILKAFRVLVELLLVYHGAC